MPLQAGTRLGPYELLAAIGSGGMGEVYRARDTRLKRHVALKILPPEFAAETDRLVRFEHEAQATAALNHPNIVAVFDVGVDAGRPFLVSELLEGATLRAVLDRDALPVRRAIDYAIQIATGLAAAHEKGISHRDLKPENIFITTEGRAKILDFGLAKITSLIRGPTSDPATEATRAAETTAGTVLGTVGYMAPEQVRGLDADYRSDLFAFGAVVYEMVTGVRAFSGATPADTISAILNREPADSIAGRADVPPALARIVAHCIEKNPAERFQSARDAVFALTTLAGSTVGSSAVVSPPIARQWPIREAIAWTLAAGAIVAMVVVGRPTSPAVDAVGAVRFAFAAPEGYVFHRPPAVPELALSPDGRTLAFVAVSGTGGRTLWVRRLDATMSIRIANDAFFPFWSPDGRYVGFNSRGRIWRVRPTERAEAESIVNSDTATGSWGPDGSILLSSVGAKANIRRARSSTGQSETILQLRRDDLNARDPSWLPDGRHILFTNAAGDEGRKGVYVADLGGTSPPLRLLPAAIRAEYSCGHILTVRDGALMAYPFDLARFAVTGDPQKVTDGVGQNPPYASLAASGTCVVAFGSGYATTASQLSFVDREGHWISDIGAASDYADLRLSPDGTRIATKQYKSLDDQTTWIVDLNRQVSTKLTDRLQGFPVWWPDGRRLLISTLTTDMFTRGDLTAIAADGSGAADSLTGQQNIIATDMTSDGRLAVLTAHKRDNANDLDLAVASLTGNPRVQPYLTTSSNEYDGRLSPDGKWLAYVSNETGIDEVYVQSFPQPGHKYRVSTNSGTEPKWRRDGGELFYRSDRSLFAVAVHSKAPDLQPAVPTEMMKGMNWALRGGRTQEFNWTYDILPDGRRFVVNQYSAAGALVQVNVIVNWPALLK